MYAESARLGALGSFLVLRAGFSAFSAALRCERNKGLLMTSLRHLADDDDELWPDSTPPEDVEKAWIVYARIRARMGTLRRDWVPKPGP
jgi:hypothetical protein